MNTPHKEKETNIQESNEYILSSADLKNNNVTRMNKDKTPDKVRKVITLIVISSSVHTIQSY